MNYMEEYKKWIESPFVDEKSKEELLALKNDEKEIKERFYQSLAFGTAGLRGTIGAGTNKMNNYVVARATEGLSKFILNADASYKKRGVAIAYDSRNFSDEFAMTAALTLCANGIKVFLFDSLRPVPELSFTVRYKKAIAGIVITASHNPAEYNGYKVYWEDGAQIPPTVSDEVLNYIDNTEFFTAKTMSKEDATNKGLLEIIGEEVDEKYIDAVYQQAINKDVVERVGDKFKLVYTPIHGSGNKLVRAILKKSGFKNVLVVKEQEMPDGNFPTVSAPNPENKECFSLAIELAKKENVDLIIGTDPDSDRMGIVVRNKDGEYVTMSGNQVGALLIDYVINAKMRNGKLPENGAVISTIVSTKMAKKVTESYSMKYFEVLTGFKFIGEKIHEFETENTYEYLFGFEESYGYLVGTHARDKDGVVASMLVAEMAATYSEKGMTLFDAMQKLYEKFGGFAEETISITLSGSDGIAKIQKIMEDLRANMPEKFGDFTVNAVRDYKLQKRYNLVDGTEENIDLPSSNVLYFECSNGLSFVARPSGTEPKIKLYHLVEGKTYADALEILGKAKEQIQKCIIK